MGRLSQVRSVWVTATRWAASVTTASRAGPLEAGDSQQQHTEAQAPEPSTTVVQALASPIVDNATRTTARAIHVLRWHVWARLIIDPERLDPAWFRTLGELYAIPPSKTRGTDKNARKGMFVDSLGG
jgi:hypothetical protein